MRPKPAHLTPANAARFQDQSVVDTYLLRAPYPPETFTILADLVTDTPRAVLDVGTGPGVIARELVRCVDRVDAVDWSMPMIALGKGLPGGDHPNLHWLHARIEEAELEPPYALITAGVSLHWMDWEVVLPRFHDLLTPHGVLALVNAATTRPPWHAEMREVARRFSTMQEREEFRLLDELSGRGLFRTIDERRTRPVAFSQSVEDYIEELHSHSDFSRERMTDDAANAFDAAVRALVGPYATDGRLALEVTGGVIWGAPLRP